VDHNTATLLIPELSSEFPNVKNYTAQLQWLQIHALLIQERGRRGGLCQAKLPVNDSVYAFPHPLNKLVRYLRKLHAGSSKPKSEATLNYLWPVLLKSEI